MVVGCWNGYQGLFDWIHWYYLISNFLRFRILRQKTCDFSFIVFFFQINCIFVSQIVLMRCVFDVLQLLFKQNKIWLKVILQGELNLASMLLELAHCIGILLVQIPFTPNLQLKKKSKANSSLCIVLSKRLYFLVIKFQMKKNQMKQRNLLIRVGT